MAKKTFDSEKIKSQITKKGQELLKKPPFSKIPEILNKPPFSKVRDFIEGDENSTGDARARRNLIVHLIATLITIPFTILMLIGLGAEADIGLFIMLNKAFALLPSVIEDILLFGSLILSLIGYFVSGAVFITGKIFKGVASIVAKITFALSFFSIIILLFLIPIIVLAAVYIVAGSIVLAPVLGGIRTYIIYKADLTAADAPVSTTNNYTKTTDSSVILEETATSTASKDASSENTQPKKIGTPPINK